MGHIRNRPTKAGIDRWHAYVHIKGYPPRSAAFSTEEEARDWIKSMESSLRDDESIPMLPLSVLLDRYLTEILPFKSAKYGKREIIYIEYWRSVLGNKIATSINPLEIETFANSILSHKGKSREPVSIETRRKYIQQLGYIFNVAIRKWKWMANNPVDRVDFQRGTEVEAKIRHNISDKLGTDWMEFKNHFIHVVHETLRKKGLPINAGTHLMKLFGMSKTSLQHLFAEETNSTLATMYHVLSKLGLSLYIVNEKNVVNDIPKN